MHRHSSLRSSRHQRRCEPLGFGCCMRFHGAGETRAARPAVSEAWRNAKGWNDENGSIDCITVLASVIAVVGAEAQIAVGGSASLIAGAYLAGTKTRRVRRALSAVFGG